MMIVERVGEWLKEEDGNVTADWVVLVAMALGLSLVVMTSIGGGVEEFGDEAETELATRDLGY